MRIPERSLAGEEPRNIQVPPSRKRAMTMFATLALTIVCILTGMPAPYAPDSSVLACGGECPGLCPCPSAPEGGSTLDI